MIKHLKKPKSYLTQNMRKALKTMQIHKTRVCESAARARFLPKKRIISAFFHRFSAPFREIWKKFSMRNAWKKSKLRGMPERKTKKNFGSLKKGCIFAPAFDKERHSNERRWRKRENIEFLRSRDSVCQASRPAGSKAQTSQRLQKQAILTMKSLILAQDER